MRPKEHSWAVVVAGNWNRAIFTPNWVGDQVFHASEVEALFPMLPVAPITYRKDDLSLSVDEKRLSVRCLKFTDSAVLKAESTTCGILESLPHTPIAGIGANFGFVERNPRDALLRLFDHYDEADLGAAGWDIEAKVVVRHLTREGVALNLSMQFANGCVEIDANFHHDVKDASEAGSTIKGRTLGFLTCIKGILEDVHELRLDEGGE